MKDSGVSRQFVADDFIITTHRKFELADAIERLLGRHAKTAYMVLLSLFLYGALWAYSSVFGTSVADEISWPFPHDTDARTRFYVGVFGFVAVPLSCMDLEEQVAVQVFMSAGVNACVRE